MSVEDGGLLAGELGGRAQQSYARAAASMRAAHSEAADPPCWISVIVGVEPLQCPVLHNSRQKRSRDDPTPTRGFVARPEVS